MTDRGEPTLLDDRMSPEDRVGAEVRQLARLADGTALTVRPKRAIGRRLLAISGVAALLASPVLLSPEFFQRDDAIAEVVHDDSGRVSPESAAGPETSDDLEATSTVVDIARYEDVVLASPSEEVLLLAYHEASFPDALGLEPVGVMRENNNVTKFVQPPDRDGPGYVILSSRGRPTSATSALDIAIPPDTPVLSVVTGTVADVDGFYLYGRYADARLEIVPDGRPDLRVVIIHVDGVLVAAGDRVVAGETVIAERSTQFPFTSQIDRHIPGPPGPHIHVEVKRADGSE